MGRLITSSRKQKAVLMEKTGVDRYGNPICSTGTEITVRWEERQEQIVEPNGEVIQMVALAIVNQDIPEGSVMWLGQLANFASPYTNLLQVFKSTSIPDLRRGTTFRRTVMLTRFKNQLPTIA